MIRACRATAKPDEMASGSLQDKNADSARCGNSSLRVLQVFVTRFLRGTGHGTGGIVRDDVDVADLPEGPIHHRAHGLVAPQLPASADNVIE
jgi:hypothetical protein